MSSTNINFALLIVVWLITSFVLLMFYWKRRKFAIGLTLTYMGFLSVTHLAQGIIYAMPWYTPLYEPSIILTGFFYATLAFVSLTIGTIILYPFFRNPPWRREKIRSNTIFPAIQTQIPPHTLAATYIVIGLLSYFVFARVFANVPTVSAFSSSLKHLLPIGIVLTLWFNFRSEAISRNSVIFLIILSILWPLVTIALDGFLGFGIVPTTVIIVFLLLQLKKLKYFLLIIPIVVFLGLSLFATYFTQRNDIRDVVWRNSTFESRALVTLNSIIGRFGLFDPSNVEHLGAIDARLTQNYLVGLGVQRIESGTVELANGQTLVDGFLMLIPRAVWFDKALVVGGQALVNKYTGVYMYGGTSVALGPVLEFYVNFGVLGVIGGFLILGVIIRIVDENIINALRSKRLMDASLWFIPAFALLLTEDNFLTLISSGVSSFLTLFIFNYVIIVVLSMGRITPVQREPLK